ncbi:hypothetical protein E2C01_050693 [Portunus trituberculatus]|uniref:Uncharacterized protein n=1 Tax=Portunus trituberculatus TaxID=210409 RepID=A0A5B7GHP2_PORTR|nr:hypothetical protein [Portunus trituberculatus]
MKLPADFLELTVCCEGKIMTLTDEEQSKLPEVLLISTSSFSSSSSSSSAASSSSFSFSFSSSVILFVLPPLSLPSLFFAR